MGENISALPGGLPSESRKPTERLSRKTLAEQALKGSENYQERVLRIVRGELYPRLVVLAEGSGFSAVRQEWSN